MPCRCMKPPKRRPYGSIGKGLHWCDGCDANLVPPDPKKKAERQRARREIEKERKRIGK